MARLILTLILLGWIAPPALAQENAERERLHRLFAEDWDRVMRNNPLYATAVGDHRFNDLLPEVSVEAYQRQLEEEREMLGRLREINRAALDRDDQINYDIFERRKLDNIADYEFSSYLIPITSRSGFHVMFPQLGQQVPLNSVQDYENYIARLDGFRRLSDQNIELMRTALAEGWVLPAVTLEGIEDAIRPHIVDDPTGSLLFGPFESFPEAVPAGQRDRLRTAGGEAIMNSVVPGYRAFYSFMTDEYIPAARETIAASALPDGAAYYEYLVRSFTTLDLTPQEVHDTGLSEVQRIRGEMQEIIDGVGFEGTFDEFVQFLRTDDRFYADTPEELMKEVAYVLKRMDGELPRLFSVLPRMPYGIREVPAFIAPRTTTAYYQRPAGDGTRAGFYYVNTYDLRSRPLYEVEALSLHEAVPGHHLQIALQQELEGLPDFRRFAGFTVFVEGWALYAERLGLEVGFYEDPYSDFGRLTYEMWRALRLVVDTGMHYFGWSRQQAIDYMAANSALTLHNITTEVDRYISWPGQALAYKIGELKIRELRSQAEQEMGDAFDVRIFHDVVLGSGSVPLDVLEENVERYIRTGEVAAR